MKITKSQLIQLIKEGLDEIVQHLPSTGPSYQGEAVPQLGDLGLEIEDEDPKTLKLPDLEMPTVDPNSAASTASKTRPSSTAPSTAGKMNRSGLEILSGEAAMGIQNLPEEERYDEFYRRLQDRGIDINSFEGRGGEDKKWGEQHQAAWEALKASDDALGLHAPAQTGDVPVGDISDTDFKPVSQKDIEVASSYMQSTTPAAYLRRLVSRELGLGSDPDREDRMPGARFVAQPKELYAPSEMLQSIEKLGQNTRRVSPARRDRWNYFRPHSQLGDTDSQWLDDYNKLRSGRATEEEKQEIKSRLQGFRSSRAEVAAARRAEIAANRAQRKRESALARQRAARPGKKMTHQDFAENPVYVYRESKKIDADRMKFLAGIKKKNG